MKFKVGDMAKYLDATVKVKEVTAQDLQPYLVGYLPGHEWRCSEEDLELVQPEVVKEPVPGRFYRTRDGSKMQYVGKAGDIWVYCDAAYVQKSLVQYDEPYKYISGDTRPFDIEGEWVDVLPAMEIKRWAVVYILDNGMAWRRGDKIPFQDDFYSLLAAQNFIAKQGNPEELEIVELTGVLPERVVNK
jgi:hypothetical protein